MKTSLSYPIYIYIYLLHNWKHGFDKTDCALFLSSYICVCERECVFCLGGAILHTWLKLYGQ